MNDDARENDPVVVPVPSPFPTATVLPDSIDAAEMTPPEAPRVSARYVWFMVLAQFGVFMAFITPIAISLAVRLAELAPNNQEYLGFITGAGALWVMLTAPFMGIWSDRTRSRLGRRRPFMIGGMLVGVVSLVVMALAPSVLVLGAGWILAQWGWGTVLGNLQNSTADRLPESQRGKVAGLTGFATQVAPVIGVIATMGLTGDPLLLFLVPGIVGVVFVILFVTLVHEDDSRGLPLERIGLAGVLGKYVFNPRRYADFSWNWLGRFLFYFGLTLNTTFTAYFFADRLGVSVTEVSGIIGILGAVGVLATTAGALGGGFLSDRLRRRRVFLVIGGSIMAAGMVTMALSSDLAFLFAGSLIVSLGIGLFSAVDMALLLDVLPERQTDAGRFMGITGFATSIPQAAAPFIASAILLIGVTDGAKNYGLLFFVAAALVFLGGLVILRIKSVR
ncbi:MFS transporter [Microbacterium hydrocarbonoxydans]|uniref:MFS-type transporter involved in bile tolerance, Atg22 family n=1 Tax=Microbacterium hydrocarbonoxydans TaxID=273678 RepID=A0A1H4JI05_9MICO|nr:MFS transporter [Microbacterium hydrocarbonoxydans]SEB45954.1 MFS-type transporter involved in bile tolerance, Atg22 family [Microbacterium hydrocarbonoxydans]